MDPNNPVVNLCVAGMKEEAEGRRDQARLLFTQAWEQSTDDFEACIAAHYLARHQKTPEEARRWNQESLDRAAAVQDERTRDFYPSLYLNLGKSHEDLGNRDEARKFYELAATCVNELTDGRYGNIVRHGIVRGLQRVSGSVNS